MQIIPVPELPPATAALPAAWGEALAGLIGAIGSDDFSTAGLRQLNRCLTAGWWSVYRLFDEAPPRLHANASCGVPDGTMRSWQVYREQLYRFDDTFNGMREHLAQHRLGLVHVHASEVPARHRTAIYSRHGIRERLSLATRSRDDGALLAVNLYRHESQRGFADRDFELVQLFSQPLLACIERHIALGHLKARRSDPLAPLTPREREVCQRLLKGWTHDGIAVDLGLSATTVKTYRDRAFERLGIHHRNELFALALQSHGAVMPSD